MPAYPSIEIDIAVVVDENISNEDLLNEINKRGTNILEKVILFDIYRGKQIQDNKKSMAYSLTFRDKKRTLKDSEIEIITNRILENLRKKFGAELRK